MTTTHLPIISVSSDAITTEIKEEPESHRHSVMINVENHLPVISSTSSVGGSTNALKSRKDRNRTRSIRDKYKLPLRLPQPAIKGMYFNQ